MEYESALDDDLFATYRVRELDTDDFFTNAFLRIALKAEGCSLILFYMPRNPTSRAMRNIWNKLSEDLSGVNFFAVNVSRRPGIMEAFSKVAADPEHPLYHYQLRGFPTIITYRETAEQGVSVPQAYYNGQLSYDALLNYCLTLACVPGHKEFPALREGVITDNDIIVTDPRSVVDEPASSLEFSSGAFEGGVIDINATTEDAYFNQQTQYEDQYDQAALDLEASRRIPPDQFRRYFSTENEGMGSIDPGLLDALDVGLL